MTEQRVPHTLDASAFYNSLAPDYDGMTGFAKRFAHEKPFFRLLVENRGIRTALDAGSGTGFHSLLLAGLGVRVTAVDVSGEMLDRLEVHSREMALDVRRVRSDFAGLGDLLTGPYDAVFCMGNTLPHLQSETEIRETLSTFATLLPPGGLLFLQVLNYERILALHERVQGARESGGITTVRFYDLDAQGRKILFNILRLEKKEEKIGTALITIPLLPLTHSGMMSMLEESGFSKVASYGSIAMEPFDPAESKDLVILATTS
ncbi:MAG TPA: class I SAM-dependent methyltransferase [Bacteroidota bacterium]|nr:class I SAM-dependent methyltransferase [Bacteroidota bacterium]